MQTIENLDTFAVLGVCLSLVLILAAVYIFSLVIKEFRKGSEDNKRGWAANTKSEFRGLPLARVSEAKAEMTDEQSNKLEEKLRKVVKAAISRKENGDLYAIAYLTTSLMAGSHNLKYTFANYCPEAAPLGQGAIQEIGAGVCAEAELALLILQKEFEKAFGKVVLEVFLDMIPAN
jgi:hypothetical protein